MATSVSTSVVNLSEFYRDLVAFAVANAGFTDATTGSTTVQGHEIFQMTKTVGGHTPLWTFEDIDSTATHHKNSKVVMTVPGSVSSLPSYISTFGINGPFEGYWFFTEGTCVHAVLEILPGIYNHLSFGNVAKAGVWEGGAYLVTGYYGSTTHIGGGVYWFSNTASSYCTPFGGDESSVPHSNKVHVVVDGKNTIYRSGNTGVAERITFFNRDTNSHPIRTNQATLRAPLTPSYVRAKNQISGLRQLIGMIPGVCAVDMEFIIPEEVVNTNWRAFPLVSIAGNRVISPDTGFGGLAYEIT